MSNNFISKVEELGLSLVSHYTNAKTKVTLKCSAGHTWSIIPSNFMSKGNGRICRICTPLQVYNKKDTEYFLKELSVLFPDTSLISEYLGARKPVMLQCTKGHTWGALPTNIISHNSGGVCQICTPTNVSKGEKELLEFIRSQYSGWIETNVRGLLTSDINLEIDIVLPDLGICFEYNGVYFHQESKRGRVIHQNKCKWLMEEYGWKLIQVLDIEWQNQGDIVKSRIKNILGNTSALYGRNCSIREISFPAEFLRANHLQGAGAPTSINLGLFYYDELVSVMTFRSPRFDKDRKWELVRFCTLLDISVVGGASKLLKYFRNIYPGSIVSYSDKRWSSGELYKTLGFELSHTSAPNYKYYKGQEVLSRYQCQKHMLKSLLPEYYKEELSEKSIMENAGYYAVYDAGNDVWILD